MDIEIWGQLSSQKGTQKNRYCER